MIKSQLASLARTIEKIHLHSSQSHDGNGVEDVSIVADTSSLGIYIDFMSR